MSLTQKFHKHHEKNSDSENRTRKSTDVLNMQLRIACADGNMHAVRYLLEEGGEPFHIVSSSITYVKENLLTLDLLFSHVLRFKKLLMLLILYLGL